jgi:U3 small nucleolar RNA-associated protein 22
MAPPATKRRKLEHSDSEADSDGSFAGFDDVEHGESGAVKATPAPRPARRPAPPSLHDGVYTAESFKSNLFRLQVDELLEQVRLKYGKKAALAEGAMRTLKNIIEQIPRRDALPVRSCV